MTPPAPLLVGAVAQTMPFERFLPLDDNRDRRLLLWLLFRAAEKQAFRFAAAPDRWILLARVDFAPNAGRWFPSGAIEIPRASDPGPLFHEVFHTVFHKSALHAGDDEPWGDPFCDAFRFFAEQELLPGPPSPFVRKLQDLSTRSFEESLTRSTDPGWTTKYGYPASLIVRRSGGTLAGLRELWFALQSRRRARGGDILDQEFGYSVQKGAPLAQGVGPSGGSGTMQIKGLQRFGPALITSAARAAARGRAAAPGRSAVSHADRASP